MDDRPLPEFVEPLRPYLYPGRPKPVALFEHFPFALHGRRGPVVFICTIEHDGQVELSLVQADPKERRGAKPKRCSKAAAVTFLNKLGFPKPVEITKRPTTWHLVMVKGTGVVH